MGPPDPVVILRAEARYVVVKGGASGKLKNGAKTGIAGKKKNLGTISAVMGSGGNGDHYFLDQALISLPKQAQPPRRFGHFFVTCSKEIARNGQDASKPFQCNRCIQAL